jgi:orotate phosphoribosyltransferase
MARKRAWVEGGVTRLFLQYRLSLHALHETLAQAVSASLGEAIDKCGEGVDRGIFRGPALGLTNRWIRAEELLAGTVGFQLSAFVLARKVEAALHMEGQAVEPTGIVQVQSAPEPLARHLSEWLSLAGTYYPAPSELNIGEPSIGEWVANGEKVVLCADVICTENTVRLAAAMVVGRDADPLVVACVVDGREARGPIRLLNRAIPVVSLTEARIGSSGFGNEAVTNIDPLMLDPEIVAAAEADPALGEDLFKWFAADPDVLRLGHADGPPHRHYSAFVNLEALLKQKSRDQIIGALLANVDRALTEVRAQGCRVSESAIAIWYVASDGITETLVDIVYDFLDAKYRLVSKVPVWREAVGGTWEFRVSVRDISNPMTVVIIDSWATTGSTLRRLVDLARHGGATSVAVVCLLNEMDANDADSLRMIGAVRTPTAVSDIDAEKTAVTPRRKALVPVVFRFAAAVTITVLDVHDCPICRTRDRYQLSEDVAPPRLVAHAKLLRDMLRRRDWKEVARESGADLFTLPVTAHETRDYLRWRGLLLRAVRKVGGRQEVVDRLRELTGRAPPKIEWTSVGLIRLLAAEQQWLRLPPLHFHIAVELLSQVCVSCLEQVTAPPWLRVQALMVISAAIPQRLVELLPRLLDLAGNEPVLIDQMLLDCCLLLLRSPGDLPIDIAQLGRNLQECRDLLEEQRAGPNATRTEDHLHSVRNLLTVTDYRLSDKPKDAQAAWERLREDLVRPVVRHRLEAELLLVRSFVEDLERFEASAEAARAANADWDTCARKLEQRALVNLPPLRNILEGDFVADWLGRRDQNRLLTLAQPNVGELRAVTDKLHAFAHGSRRPRDPSWQAERRELLDLINWWDRMFLAAHVTDGESPALLVELIRSAPVELGRRVLKLLDFHHVETTIEASEHGEVRVFCPERLLSQIIVQLLDNVEKHKARDDNAPCRVQVEYLPSGEDAVKMVVRNTGTTPSTPRGHGLKALDEKLQAFGGKLTEQVLVDDEWTFAVTTILPLWHGG